MLIPDMEKFHENDKEMLTDLERLFRRWYKSALSKSFMYNYNADSLVFDGFYPYYYNQKVKVLFIGRESLGISGQNYITVLYDAYKNNKVGSKTINRSSFHARMFYITYALNNQEYNWSNIPYASELTDSFGTKEGISFSFMNLSKLSNESSGWSADWPLIDNFVSSFKSDEINFFNEQISILKPDLIIAMNLGKSLRALGNLTSIEKGKNVNVHKLKVNDSYIPLLNTFHFSAPAKKDPDDYFKPVIEAYKKYVLKLNKL
ncbi:hypothetical protein PRVXT_001559 [Proteinivorax tanatarense]|uniref:Uracil DNA glycosylase superfamily protein n=1 Tax=Proteinivorax tanatarense TaxID=1260629 RepID=A0AAU7VH31_9FIRM